MANIGGQEEMKREVLNAFIDKTVHDHAHARQLLREYPELLEARLMNGETVLHFLAVEGYVLGVRFLAESGADVDATNEFGDTALVDVATLGNAEVARVLLHYGADPNAASRTQDCALHAAAQSGNADLVDALLSAGARFDYRTELGETIWDAVGRAPAEIAPLREVLAKHGIRSRTK